MKRPRISIGTLMTVTAILAAVWASMRAMLRLSDSGQAEAFALGVPPMVGVLACGLLPLIRGLRRGQCPPSLVGFEVFGVLGLLLYLTCAVWFPEWIGRYLDITLSPLAGHFNNFDNEASDSVILLLFPPFLLLPQILLALLGGWLFNKLGIKLIIERPGADAPRTQPALEVDQEGSNLCGSTS